jgi:hypothetical protein
MSSMILPEAWTRVANADKHRFEAELKRELPDSHPLKNLSVECFARRDGSDDFLFYLPSHSDSFAVVHLTWSVEKKSDFPWTTFFNDAVDFTTHWRRILD